MGKTFDHIIEANPKIYVLAGANGIGKTTVNAFFVPEGVTYINADDIARQLRERLGEVNVQELANSQALERMNGFIAKRMDFAIETNLADQETWLFLKGLQGLGYRVNLNFFSVSDVNICINRVQNRVKQGGHFVHPDIVKLRYEAGLKLLRQHKSIPDQLILTDNEGKSVNCAELRLGEIVAKNDPAPAWVEFVLAPEKDVAAELTSIEDVREKYQRLKDKK